MSSMFAQVVASVRSISSRLWQRWSVLDRRVRIGAAGVAALAVAGAVTGVVLLMSGGGGPRCDKPLCIEVLGPGGEDVSTMAAVRIRLAGSLDRHIALSALKISNEPAGRREFVGDVMTFRPEWPGFARGTAYDVSLKLSATEVPRGADPVDLGFRFQTQGKLQVASVFPQDGSQEVALDGAIMVQFNRSVAPLTVIAKRGPDAIVTFDPPIAGRGRWLNTSLYTFTPAGTGWAPSTRYTARVKAGLANELGSTLDADYVFSFTTLLPKAVTFFPPDNSKFVAPLPEIKAGFNQPVDRASAAAAFAVVAQASRAPVAGGIEWTDDRTLVSGPRVRWRSTRRTRLRCAAASRRPTAPPRPPARCAGRSAPSACRASRARRRKTALRPRTAAPSHCASATRWTRSRWSRTSPSTRSRRTTRT